MKTNRQSPLSRKLPAILLTILLLAGCKDLFHPEGSSESENNFSGSAPSAPSSISGFAQSSNSIRVSWSTVSGATGYRVYRSSSSSGTYSQTSEVYTTSHTDTGLSPNTTYYYKVSAYNSYGESALSYYYTTVTTHQSNELPNTPSAPSSVSASAQSSSSITVSWSTVSGATGYRVYRSSSSSGTYSQTSEVYTTSHTDAGLSPNTTYYYKVSAYNSSGESARSSYASATTHQDANSTAPSFGTPLELGQTAQNSINTTPQYYYFLATSGRSYTIYWYDWDSNSENGDIAVSAYWDSDGSSIFSSTDIGYSGKSFTAYETGYVMLEVTQVVSTRSGPYQILYR